jgi:hypothetical protein
MKMMMTTSKAVGAGASHHSGTTYSSGFASRRTRVIPENGHRGDPMEKAPSSEVGMGCDRSLSPGMRRSRE